MTTTSIYFKQYADFLRRQWRVTRPLRVVVDGSNGTGALLFKRAAAGVKNLSVTYLNDIPDGAFPGHGPNPSYPETTDALIVAVREARADLGVIFDNDADRVVFVDATGRRLSGTEALIFLGDQYDGPVVVNSLIGPVAARYFKERGRRVITTKVGFSFVRAAMARSGAPFGGEYSGHYFFKKIWHADCAVFSAISFINQLSSLSTPLDGWLAQLPRYYQEVINFPCSREKYIALRTTFKKKFTGVAEKVSLLDGIKVEFSDRWFSLRPSNNEDLVRLTVEAESPALLAETVAELKKLL